MASSAKVPVHVWRTTRRKHASGPLDGEGARLHGGRWNLPGTALVYTAGNLALAVLETLVHVDRGEAPRDLVAVELAIPDDLGIEELDPTDLPRTWRRYPAPHKLAVLGTRWVSSLRTAVLRVPSAVVPRDHNYLLNPAHPDLTRIEVLGTEPLRLDPRLLSVPPARRRTKRIRPPD